VVGQRVTWLARHPAWPVTALLAGYPLWWALGVGDFMWIILAVPMAARLAAWWLHGSRPIRLPPGFGFWLAFLAWTGASVIMLKLGAPGTVSSPLSHRLVAYADRTATYLALTVLLLYVGNLTERELPRRKLAALIGLLGGYAVALGIAAIALPHFEFNSPTLALVPHHLRGNAFIQAQMHPALAQVQDVFGTITGQGRAKAPFDYTNTWGECLTIALPWLVVVCFGRESRRWQRVAGVAALAFGAVALVYSLNRAAWIAAAIGVVYLALRLAARGRTAFLGGLTGLLVVVAAVALFTPLSRVVSLRLQHGGSNDIRASLFALSMRDGVASPVLGYGDTRQQRGSVNSIAIGPTNACPICGSAEVGSTGQFSLVLVCTGFVGVALFFGFFGYLAWRYRRDRSPYGMAAELVILLSFLYMWFYDAVPAPLGLTMLACASLWRDDWQRHASLAAQSAGVADQMPRPRLLASRTIEVAGSTPAATASAR
jgi:hypothetical protein